MKAKQEFRFSGAVRQLLFAEGEPLEQNPALVKAFGARLKEVLAEDLRPMILELGGILDKGNIVNGEQTWGAKGYNQWMPESVFLQQLAPALIKGVGFRGHIYSGDYTDPPIMCVWAGMNEQGTPAAWVYVMPDETSLRNKVKVALAVGNVSRLLPFSLAFRAEMDEKTGLMMRIVDKEAAGIDLVRLGEIRSARARSAVFLNKLEDGKMEVTFASEEELQNSAIIKQMVASAVAVELAKPENIKKAVLSANLDQIKERPEAKAAFERPATREEVVLSLKPEEVAAAFVKNPALEKSATEKVKALAEKRVQFAAETRKKMEEAKIPERDINLALAGHEDILFECNGERRDALVKTIVEFAGGGATRKGQSENSADRKGQGPEKQTNYSGPTISGAMLSGQSR